MSGATTIVRSFLGLALLAAATIGCGGGKAPTSAPSPRQDGGAPEAVRVAKVNPERLPALGEPFPQPLDQGRVRLSDPPAPWLRLRYRGGRLAAWSTTRQGDFPRLVLTAAPAGESDPQRLGADKLPALAAFAQRLRAEFAASGEKVVEPPSPLTIGENAFVRYTKAGRLPNGVRVERLLLMTVAAGRRYTLTLETLDKDSLLAHRDAAYAVAAGMEISDEPAPAVAWPDEPAQEEASPDPVSPAP